MMCVDGILTWLWRDRRRKKEIMSFNVAFYKTQLWEEPDDFIDRVLRMTKHINIQLLIRVYTMIDSDP